MRGTNGSSSSRLLAFVLATSIVAGLVSCSSSGDSTAGGTTAATGPDTAATNPAQGGVIRGRVVHAGSGVEGTVVSLFGSGGTIARGTKTKADGSYEIRDVAPGTYTLFFAATTGDYPGVAYWSGAPDPEDAKPIVIERGTVITADEAVYTAAEQPVPPFTGNSSGPRVAIIGDSITQQSVNALHKALDGSSYTSVIGIKHQRIDQMQPAADKYAQMNPDRVVLALGTNNAMQVRPVVESTNDLDRLIATFPQASCVVVVNVSDGTEDMAFNLAAQDLNKAIGRLPSRFPQVRIADWQKERADALAQGEPGGPWTVDTIHLTAIGTKHYAELMQRGLDSCPPITTR